MIDDTEDTRLDHELAVEELVATALRGCLGLLAGPEEEVSAVLSDVAVDLVDSTEVARLDAMQGHTAAAVVRALVVPLGIEPDDLISALQARAETVPLVLVVDNGECLGSKALAALRALLQKSHGGLGVVIGGDGELADLLEQAGIEVACLHHADRIAHASDHAAPEAPDSSGGWLGLVPWRHLAAVVGLVLLVIIFWPGEEKAEKAPRQLSLPEPAQAESAVQALEPAAERHSKSRDVVEQGPAEGPAAGGGGDDPAPPAAPRPEPEPEPQPEPEAPSKPVPETSSGADAGEAGEDKVTVRERPELTGLAAELGYRQEDWLLTQGTAQWMLQLTLAANEDRARAVLDQLGRDNGAYYRARRDGGPVYIVVAGPYSSREEALGARGTLPGPVRAAGPFPRSMTAIHEEIVASESAR